MIYNQSQYHKDAIQLTRKYDSKCITIGIDATNLRRGGGRTHLIELICSVCPSDNSVKRVIVWGGRETTDVLSDKEWLEKRNPSFLDGNMLQRSLWQRFALAKEARTACVDLLFVPGGNYAGDFHPVVTMSRNMLPFECVELLRYGWSLTTLKLALLRISQSRTFSHADGIIFLTDYAKSGVERVTGKLNAKTSIIPHGMNRRFIMLPREQHAIEKYSTDTPYRILYVSIIDQYKHQWQVVEAMAKLRKETSWPLVLELVGPSYTPALKRLQKTIAKYDPNGEWVRYYGAVAYDELHSIYAKVDLGVFASSCENMPNILLETMAAGLPVASSNMGPMPEVLGNAGVYFNPEQPTSIAAALLQLINSPELRFDLAKRSYKRAQEYSWERCARDTFGFMIEVYNQYDGIRR